MDDTLKPITKKEFAELIRMILSAKQISGLFEDKALCDTLFPKGFLVTRHVLRTFPFLRKIKTVCVMSVDSADDFTKWIESLGASWNAKGESPPRSDPQ
jgi:hypothetical protein